MYYYLRKPKCIGFRKNFPSDKLLHNFDFEIEQYINTANSSGNSRAGAKICIPQRDAASGV